MKNKKWLKFFAIAISCLFVGVMVYFYTSIQEKKEKAEILKSMPIFYLKTISGDFFSTKDLKKDKNKIFIYFDINCHYCHSEAEELSKIHMQHTYIEWIWISKNEIQEIDKFAKQYQLENAKNIKWCHDNEAKIYTRLGITSIPYFLVYNKDNKLIMKHKGASKLENIIKTIN